ncbi:hypothetical protein P691DRAFT_105008 [Macrolepiota fuliginosa MF-IS2]|uniref:Uncharacterized protein n=1 Tax=Macrolepiota fuliginosa MF-IS2 TaxID=1400762 RepID=A0A9P5XDL2_9AGAR|nr:hypothetical protein P691DRAFT_105008 [Macrolepiota fuliginosa MF-IS2]
MNSGFGNDKLSIEADEGDSWMYNKDPGAFFPLNISMGTAISGGLTLPFLALQGSLKFAFFLTSAQPLKIYASANIFLQDGHYDKTKYFW